MNKLNSSFFSSFPPYKINRYDARVESVVFLAEILVIVKNYDGVMN